jgi:hypothetical protein
LDGKLVIELFTHEALLVVVQVPITPDLIYSFGPQAAYTYSALAGTLYAPVVSWVFNTPTASDPYFAWVSTVLQGALVLNHVVFNVDD